MKKSQDKKQEKHGNGLIWVLVIANVLVLSSLVFLLLHDAKPKEQEEKENKKRIEEGDEYEEKRLPKEDELPQKEPAQEGLPQQEVNENALDYNLIDMAVIAQIVGRDGVQTCELLDVDGDGMVELCIEKVMEDGWRATQYVFETWQQAGINVLTNESAAGEGQIFVSQTNGKVYLREFYASVGGLSLNLSLAENNVWVSTIYEYWDSQKESNEEFTDRVNKIESELQLRELFNNYDTITNVFLERDYNKVCTELEQYWKQTGRTFELEMVDVNGDEIIDWVYSIENYMQPWMDNVNAPSAGTNGRELFVGTYPQGNVKVILYKEDNGTRVQVHVGNELPVICYEMSDEEKASLNEYLTAVLRCNFSEYSEKEPDFTELLCFAIMYINVHDNYRETIIYNDMMEGYQADVVDSILMYYFGVTLPRTDIGGYIYKDGAYYRQAAGWGELGSSLAIVDKVVPVKRDVYEITFYDCYVWPYDTDTYEDNMTDMDTYYRSNIEDIKQDKFCEIYKTYTCQIRKKGDGYIISEYHSNKKRPENAEEIEADLMGYLYKMVPELYDFEGYVTEATLGEAKLIVRDEGLQAIKDAEGFTRYCYMIYVGALYETHSTNWHWFYIDRDSLEVLWCDIMLNRAVSLEEWRQSDWY